MPTNRPSAFEEVYFARQEAERRRERALESQRQGVEIDRCRSCKGTWLDEGELEQLAQREPGLLQKIVGAFRGG